jgi:branched-chain amino acid transport system ATP-binding protein
MLAARTTGLDRLLSNHPKGLGIEISEGGRGLSGGQRQLVGLTRLVLAQPRIMLLDEPTLGLAPLIIAQIFEIIQTIRAAGVTVFLVEQNAFHALKLAHRGYVMVNGVITMSGTGKELLANPQVRAAYLEGGRH